MNIQTSYVEVDLKDVLSHYLQGYAFTNGNQIVRSESFIDPVKEKVIFKLFVSNQNN